MSAYKVGDLIEVVALPSDSASGELTKGSLYTVLSIPYPGAVVIFNNRGMHWIINTSFIKHALNKQTKGPAMLDTVKDYLKENKSIIMTIAVALIVDHLVFGGAFREKVKALVNGLLDKAQNNLEK